MIVLTIETTGKLFSISISNFKHLIYKEIYGDNVSSNNILNFINISIYKHRIKIKQISLIIIGKGLGNLTSIKIIFAVAQVISIICSIPLLIIDSIKAFLYNQAKNFNANIYLILIQDTLLLKNRTLYDIYLLLEKRLHLFLKNKTIQKKQIIAEHALFLNALNYKKQTNYKPMLSKSIYLDLFIRYNQALTQYILPDSSSIPYIHKTNYIKYHQGKKL